MTSVYFQLLPKKNTIHNENGIGRKQNSIGISCNLLFCRSPLLLSSVHCCHYLSIHYIFILSIPVFGSPPFNIMSIHLVSVLVSSNFSPHFKISFHTRSRSSFILQSISPLAFGFFSFYKKSCSLPCFCSLTELGKIETAMPGHREG